MNDHLEVFRQYKEAFDLVDDIQKLRAYHSSQQYNAMMQHIHHLVAKYPLDAGIWNLFNRIMPNTYDQAYQNAENFLRFKGFKMLLEKGYNLSKHLTQEEIRLIQQNNTSREE